MRRYCKGINLLDEELIRKAVLVCLEKKYTRPDVIRFFMNLSGKRYDEVRSDLRERNLVPYLDKTVALLKSELEQRQLNLKPIKYTEKIDGSSGKRRRIGIEDIKQQMFEDIALIGLSPFLCYVGEYQFAAIKGRGTTRGVVHIRKWLRNKGLRVAGKADIRKNYESVDRQVLMTFLRKHIKNDLLLWLIESLINTFERGLSIGSKLSQNLNNLYLGMLYHELSENTYRFRRHKDGTVERVNLVDHVFFYADDILLLGTNVRDMHNAMKKVVSFSSDVLHLDIKPSWMVFKTKITDKRNDKGQLIDMLGFRIYRWHTTLRRSLFLRLRRNYKEARKTILCHKRMSLKMARRCTAYFGYLKNSNSQKIIDKYKVDKTMSIARKVIRNYDKSKIQ